MNKKLYIHIGLPKTGTTFLQHRLHVNAEILKNCGIYIPTTGLNTVDDDYNYNQLALALQPERWAQFSKRLVETLPHLWDDFVTEAANCDCPSIFVTSEALSWELKNAEQIRFIYEKTRNFKTQIVLCERNPYDLISSMYGHMIRTGRGPYSLQGFLFEFPYFWSGEYHRKRWGEFFGKENIISLQYESLRGELIFENFLSAVFPGHKVCSQIFEPVKDINRNASYSPRFLRFLEELSANKFDVKPFIELYSELINDIVPLESKLVTALDIDEALHRCGIGLGFSGDVLDVAILRKQFSDERFDLFEQISRELVERTQELVELRQTLVERTELLERTSKDLVDRTQELVETRQTLVERTQELVETRQTLVERTARLEQWVK